LLFSPLRVHAEEDEPEDQRQFAECSGRANQTSEAEGEANTVFGDFSLRKSSQKQSSKSKVIGGNSYQSGECITPNLGYRR